MERLVEKYATRIAPGSATNSAADANLASKGWTMLTTFKPWGFRISTKCTQRRTPVTLIRRLATSTKHTLKRVEATSRLEEVSTGTDCSLPRWSLLCSSWVSVETSVWTQKDDSHPINEYRHAIEPISVKNGCDVLR